MNIFTDLLIEIVTMNLMIKKRCQLQNNAIV